MKKVGILSGSCLLNVWNGLGRQTNALGWGLSNANYDVTIFAPSDTGSTYVTQHGQASTIHVALASKQQVASVSLENLDDWTNALSNELADKAFDVLVLTTCNNWTAAKAYREKHPSCKIVGCISFLYNNARWLPTNPTHMNMKAIEKEFLAQCDVLFTHTMALANLVAVTADREIYVVPNATLIEKVNPLFEPKPKSICYIGRLNKSKSIETLIRAVASIQDAELNVASPETSDVYSKKLCELANSLGASNRVRILGWMNTQAIRNLYRSSALAVVSGSCEPYGFAVLDPLSYGVPVLVSGFSGLSDYLPLPSQQENVYSNIGELTSLLNTKLNTTVEINEEERINGMHHVLTNYASRNVTGYMEEILR